MQLRRKRRVVNMHARPVADAEPSRLCHPTGLFLRSAELKSDQEYRVRECVHRAEGAPGGFYTGPAYVKQLQRLQSDAALRAAGRVTPFFWADAAHIHVWLCRDCAGELGLAGRESDAA